MSSNLLLRFVCLLINVSIESSRPIIFYFDFNQLVLVFVVWCKQNLRYLMLCVKLLSLNHMTNFLAF